MVIKFAKEAPAPSNTNKAGSAQHINVEDDANNATRLGTFSFILIITYQILIISISTAVCPFD